MTEPPVEVLSKLPEAIPEIVRAVVEAVAKYPIPVTESTLVVAESVLMPANCEVDEAKMPANAEIGVEVAEVFTPKFWVGVNGNDPPPAEIAPHTTVPDELVVSALVPEHEAMPEIVSAVVDAVPEMLALPNCAPPTALSWPAMVEEPVTASAVDVAPTAVSPPLNAI